jgi:hypothetical protein
VSSLHSPSTTRRSTPSRRGRAGLAAAAVLAVVVPLATACGAGFNAEALTVKPDSGSGSVGSLKVNNVWVIVDSSTGNAEVIGAVTNDGSSDSSLTGVQVGGASAEFRLGSHLTGNATSVSIGAGALVSFGLPNQPAIELPESVLTVGNLTQVTWDFGTDGSVSTTAQIEPDTGLWASYNPNAALVTPSPSPSASSSASASASASSSASAHASSSASASTSASASASPTSSK